jgi:hypothetical protein
MNEEKKYNIEFTEKELTKIHACFFIAKRDSRNRYNVYKNIAASSKEVQEESGLASYIEEQKCMNSIIDKTKNYIKKDIKNQVPENPFCK